MKLFVYTKMELSATYGLSCVSYSQNNIRTQMYETTVTADDTNLL